jgi:WD40 repeat protein
MVGSMYCANAACQHLRVPSRPATSRSRSSPWSRRPRVLSSRERTMTRVAAGSETSKPSTLRFEARWFARLLSGDDIFISYARRDASSYVLALANRLISNGLSCFLDQFNGETGITLPPGVVKALGRSSMLVVVATPGTIGSVSIDKEVRLFRDYPGRARPIVVVNIGQSLALPPAEPDWRQLLVGLHAPDEPFGALENTVVSDAIVARIVGAATFTRRNRRLRNLGTASAIVVAVLFVIAGLLTWQAAKAAQEVAAKGKELQAKTATLAAAEQKLRSTQAYSDSLALSADSRRELDTMPHRALRLALDAAKKEPTAEARQSLVRALDRYVPNLELSVTGGYVYGGGFLPGGRVAAATAKLLRVWGTNGAPMHDIAGVDEATAAFPLRGGSPCWRAMSNLNCLARDTQQEPMPLLGWQVFDRTRGRTTDMVFNAASTLVAVHDRGAEKLAVWSTSGGPALFLRYLPTPKRWDRTLTFAPQGVVTVGAPTPNDVTLVELPNGLSRKVGEIRGELVGPVVTSPDGLWFAIPTSKGVEVWSSSPVERRDVLFGGSGDWHSGVSISARGRLLGALDDVPKLAFLREGKLQSLRSGPAGSSEGESSFAFSPVVETFATYGERTATISTISNDGEWRLSSTLRGHSGSILGAVFDDAARRLLTWDAAAVRLWDATPRPAKETVVSLNPKNRLWPTVELSPDGKVFLFEDSSDVLWRIDEEGVPSLLHDPKLPMPVAMDAHRTAFDATGTYLAVSVQKHPILIWKVGQWGVHVEIPLAEHERDDSTPEVAVSAKGDVVAASDPKVGLTVWNTAQAEPIARRREGIYKLLGMSPDGRLIAFMNSSATYDVVVWDHVKNKDLLTQRGQLAAFTLGTFDQTGRYFVSAAGESYALDIWRIQHDGPSVRMEKYSTIRETREVSAGGANWSRDGRLLVTHGFEDRKIKVWEVATGNLLLEGTEAFNAAFVADTSTLIALTRDTVRHQSCEPCAPLEELLRTGEQRLKTGLW